MNDTKKTRYLYEFDDKSEKKIYKKLRRSLRKMFLKKKEKAGTDEITTYIEWRAYVQQKYKKYSKKELIDFAKFLEWQAEEKQIDQNTVNAYMLIVFTAIITEAFKNMLLDPMFEMVGKVPWVNVELFSILTAIILVLFVCGIIELVGYIIKKHRISDNSFYLDYKKIIDEMIERKEKKKK